MGWTSYYVGNNCNRKDECMRYLKGYKDLSGNPTVKVIKTVMKGSKFYALLETVEKGQQWILCLLTSVENGEFYYKDIQCNPYEVGGIPASLLKAFKPSNDEDKEWLKKNLAKIEEDNKKTKVTVGDILKCHNGYGDIVWGNGYRTVKENTDFYVRVETKNPFAKRQTKIYRLLDKTENGYRDTNCRVMEKTIKNLPKVELVK